MGDSDFNGHPSIQHLRSTVNHKTTEIEVSLNSEAWILSRQYRNDGKKRLEKSTNIDQLIEDYLARIFMSSHNRKKSIKYLDKDVGITNTWVSSHLKLEAIKISKVLRSEILYSLMTLKIRKT